MLIESGRVVAIETDRLWVETINRTSCGSCAAEKGCGQSLLSRWMARSAYLPVNLDGRSAEHFKVNDQVNIGIPEDVVVKSSLLLYILPIMFMVAGVWLGSALFDAELASVLGALFGLVIGAALVKLFAARFNADRRSRPVLVELMDVGVSGPART